MPKKWRHWALCAVLAGGGVLAAWSLRKVPFFQILNLKAYDAHFVVRRSLFGAPEISKIVLLTADQKAIDNFPEMRMFWNKHYATAITAAGEAGAKVIGLDLAFGSPIDKYEPGYDGLLAGAIGTSPVPVIVGFVERLNSNQIAQQLPVNMVAAGLGWDAFVNLTDDPDGFYRTQELIEAPSSKPNDPPPARSLALRVVEKYLGSDAEFRNRRLFLRGLPVPISRTRAIAINYAGGPNTFPSVSLADFEAAAAAGDKAKLRNWVNGKIVLIGTDFVDDRYYTPFFTPLRKNSDTAGVEIHANTVRTLLEGRYLLSLPAWLQVLALALAATATVLVTITADPGRAVLYVLLVIAGTLLLTHGLFEYGLILSTSEMLLVSSICLIASVIYRFATAEKRRNLFHRAVALFVGKQLATSLEETESIALSGKKMDVTILFTDIRGFTAFTEQICDQQGPEVVVQMLNEYLAAMVAIVLKHHGHANKFIGDGILAIFCDDDEGATAGDHALRAVQCATEMVTAPSRFSTGAGIHTGAGVLGNIGSADKMEYTVLGDTVNLASRLESLNKEHHTKLLMSGATQSRLSGKVDTEYLADAPVRGKALPISLYTVASLVPKAVVNA